MPDKLSWGILSTSDFASRKFVPGIMKSELGEASAVASRDAAKAAKFAATFGMAKAYGSYEELLADPDIDIVYVPLPNHLHVPWSIKAMEAGKHVLCEKPLALNAGEVGQLIAARDRAGVKVGEAFMVRTHPQWLRVRELVREGTIGDLRVVQGFFSFFNADPANIRNIPQTGGGAVYDLGCYPCTMSRFLFEAEPRRVCALIDRDPEFGTDRITSAILDFPSGQAVWTASTQLVAHQRIHAVGTKARIELQIPFNALPDVPMKILINAAGDLLGGGIRTEEVPVCNQYAVESDAFCRAVMNNTEVPVPPEDSLRNMAVIDAVFRSASSGRWEQVES